MGPTKTPFGAPGGRLLVASSGGVDSAVALALLADEGAPLVSVFMRNGVSGAAAARSCCSLSDARDARAVADRLGVPFYVHDLSRPFARLMDEFADDYLAGRTPNPCIACNNRLKFGALLELADDLGCDAVASGHYARLEDGRLMRAADRAKDQSYLLHGLTPAQLARARLPLGRWHKQQVRAEARRRGLPVADKPDSADICFVPGGDYRELVARRRGSLGVRGELVDESGKVLGVHEGVATFTVGQRRGLGLALGRPAYVTALDPVRGRVAVGGRHALRRSACLVGPVNRLGPWSDGARVHVQLRQHHRAEAATLHEEAGACVAVRFEAPSTDVVPGQYAVFYEGECVLGGGRILRSDDP